MAQLILMRHGETEWTREHRHTGRTNLPLTMPGRQQAGWARGIIEMLRADTIIISSPLERARQTAVLATNSDPVIDNNLVEFDNGEAEGATTEAVRQATNNPSWDIFADGTIGLPRLPESDIGQPLTPVTRGEGEDNDMALARIKPSIDKFEQLMQEGYDVMVVSHGHIIATMLAYFIGYKADRSNLTQAEQYLFLKTAQVIYIDYLPNEVIRFRPSSRIQFLRRKCIVDNPALPKSH